MNEIKIFENKEFGEVRTIEKGNETWFVGKDICTAFGDKNHNRALSRIDDVDKTKEEIIDSLGRKQNIIFINESGLYSLLFAMQPQKTNKDDGSQDAYPIETQERIKKLHQFKRWITHEVLPSIRKHGGYVQGQESMSPDELMARALQYADSKIKELQITNSNLSVQTAIMQPKAEYFDNLVDRNLLTNFRDTANELNIPQKKFITYLIDKKYLYRDKKGKLKPYASKDSNELFETKEFVNNKTNFTSTQTLVTPKGREFFRLLTTGIA